MINSWAVVLETLEPGYRTGNGWSICPGEASAFCSMGNYNVKSIASVPELLRASVTKWWTPRGIYRQKKKKNSLAILLKILCSLIFANWQIIQKIAGIVQNHCCFSRVIEILKSGFYICVGSVNLIYSDRIFFCQEQNSVLLCCFEMFYNMCYSKVPSPLHYHFKVWRLS